jgi:hypothetical protein
MIEALTGGERRGAVLAGLAQGRLRTAGKMAGLSMACGVPEVCLACELRQCSILELSDRAP